MTVLWALLPNVLGRMGSTEIVKTGTKASRMTSIARRYAAGNMRRYKR